MIRIVLLLLCFILASCAIDWKGAGFESEQQYQLAAARKLSPFGAKLFFSYGIKTPTAYDAAVSEMKSSKYPSSKDSESDSLAEFLENKQKGSLEGLTPLEFRAKLIRLEKEAENLKASQIKELEAKILEKKWAENKKQCELGNYTIYSKNLPGVSYYALNKNFINSYDGIKLTYKTTLPKKFEITQKNKGIDLIAKLSGDPDSFASRISVEIELQEDEKIKVNTVDELIDLQDLMKRKTYLDVLRSPAKYTVDKKTTVNILCN